MKIKAIVMQKIYSGKKYDKFIVKDIENNNEFICSIEQGRDMEIGSVHDMDISFSVGFKKLRDKNIFYQRVFVY